MYRRVNLVFVWCEAAKVNCKDTRGLNWIVTARLTIGH
jgi:hypothetical protein